MIGEQAADKTRDQAEAELRLRLTDEFMATLEEAVKVVGWGCDAIESVMFLDQCREIRGQPWIEDINIYTFKDEL